MAAYLYKASRFFVYASLVSVVLVNRSLFFPFITGKALWFRTSIELALVSFLIFLVLNPGYLKQLKSRLLHPVTLSVIAFAIAFTFTSLISVNPANSFWSNFERSEGAFQILHYAAFFILAMLLFTTKEDWRKLLKTLTVISVFIFLYVIGQTISVPGVIAPTGAASGTFGNPSYLAGFLVFLIFFASWLFKNEQSVFWKTFFGILIPASLVMIYLSQTAAVFGAITVGAAVVLLTTVRNWPYRRRLLAITLTIVLIVLSFHFIWQIKDGRVIRGLLPRFWTWGSALAGILEKPLFGWGMENFPYVFDKYYNANHYGIESWFDRAHNIFLDYLIAGGIILLLAYLAIFFFYYKTLRRSRTLTDASLFYALPVVYLVQGLTLFEILPLYLPLFLFLALFVNYSLNFNPANIPGIRYPLHVARYLIGLLLIGLLVVSLYFTSYLPFVKNSLIIATSRTENKSLQEVFNTFDKALNFNSPVGQDELESNLFLFTADLLNFLEEQNSPIIKNQQTMEQIIAFNEHWFNKNYKRYAGVKNLFIFTTVELKVYELTGNKNYLLKAKNLADLGAKLAPSRVEFIDIQMRIAQIEKNEEALKKIRAKLEKLRPDLVQSLNAPAGGGQNNQQ